MTTAAPPAPLDSKHATALHSIEADHRDGHAGAHGVHSSTLRAMERRGLITLTRHGHGRASYLRAVVTDSGRAAYAAHRAEIADRVEGQLDALWAAGRAQRAVPAAQDAPRVDVSVEPPADEVPSDALRPVRWMRFVHARHLSKVDGVPVKHWPHEVCEVTRVTDHAVYYRTVGDARTGWYSAPERFADEVLEVLADYPEQTDPATVGDLVEGDVFSADEGMTWHTVAEVEPGRVAVYTRPGRAPETIRRVLNLEAVEPVMRGVRA